MNLRPLIAVAVIIAVLALAYWLAVRDGFPRV